MSKISLKILLAAFITAIFVQSGCFAAADGREGYILVDDFAAIYNYIDKNDVKVKVRPGTYNLDRQDGEPLIAFTGNGNQFDFTGVNLIADRPCNTIIGVVGDNILIDGLHIQTNENYERCAKGVGTLGINITGNSNTLQNVSLLIQDSYPYGYGSNFGIGRESSVKLSKAAGLRIGPAKDTVIRDCKVVMRAFGHGIFIRGAENTLIEGTSVEGVLRQSDDILMERAGTAAEKGYLKFDGELIRPGRITSLQEDGIRIYSDSGTERNYNGLNNKKTGNVTVRNCTVSRMRRGICLALGGSGHIVEDCTVLECARVGYNIGSNTVVKNCKGDAKYSQLLDIASSSSRNADVELEVLDSRQRQINSFENDPDMLAKINGENHSITIKPAAPEAVPSRMTIEIGGNVGWSSDSGSEPKGQGIRLRNRTAAWVLLHPAADKCLIESAGAVVDYGEKNNNAVIRK